MKTGWDAFTGKEFDIKPFEVQAVLEAFILWAKEWPSHRVFVRTDNTVASSGLARQTTKGRANKALRQIMLLAAKHDIEIIPEWIAGHDNQLADALSRGSMITVANFAPNLQNLSLSPRRRQHGASQ